MASVNFSPGEITVANILGNNKWSGLGKEAFKINLPVEGSNVLAA